MRLRVSVRALLAAVTILAMTLSAQAQSSVRLHAAGSLREAFTEIARRFERDSATPVVLVFGASGLLRDRLANGEASDVFASANLEHPQSLADAGVAGPVRRFARNQLCALVSPRLGVDTRQLLAAMLDPNLKLGTSTPRADPSGDYAWQVFEKAEALQAGSRAVLEAKAQQLTGGPTSAPPPAGRSVYALLVDRGDADIFLTYCTNAVQAKRERPSLQVVALPDALAVGAEYGLTTLNGASAQGRRFADYLLGPGAREVLAAAGFGLP